MTNPKAIPDYLDKHFKEKAKLKKERQMMGESEDELREKIQEMEGINTAGRKLINVKEFQKRKEKLKEEYIWS